MKSRAQTIVEFLVIYGAVLFFFVAFLLVIETNIEDKNLDKQRALAQNIVLSVQNEISLAFKSSDGYYREFRIPQDILGKAYEIGIDVRSVYITGEKIGVSYKILEVQGDLQKGVNTIRKEGGVVILN